MTFLSSHVLALASTGLRTGIVIDIGWHDTRILPVLLFFDVTNSRFTNYGR